MANSVYYLKVDSSPDGTLSDGCVAADRVTEYFKPQRASDESDWLSQSCTHLEEESRDEIKPLVARAKKLLSPKLGRKPVRQRLRHRMSMTDTPLAKLPNCLLDMCVLVGLDQDTGVRTARKEQDATQDEESMPSLFSLPLEPQILGVISNQLAYYPNSKTPIDPFYPPVVVKSVSKGPQNPLLKRGTSRRISIKPRPAVYPLNQELIAALPTLCFPSEAFLSKNQPPEAFQYLVLTSISGSRSYATCLTFHRRYLLNMTSGSRLELYEEPDNCDIKDTNTCWVPFSICAISSQPYFLVMKQCLSSLRLYEDSQRLLESLKRFTLQMTRVPAPPAGPLHVTFCIGDSKKPVIVHPPDNPEKQVVDIPLNLPFLCFSVDDVLTIVACILSQQRLVFVSQDYALLTPIVECFLVFILPFKWPFVYVPVVSTSLLDLLEAPGCFIMGCNAVHRLRISQIEGLVIIDIDRGQVDKCPTIEVPPLPEAGITAFKKNYHLANSRQYDIASLSKPSTLTQSDSFREDIRTEYQKNIQLRFIEMFFVLFRDINEFMNFDQNRFKTEEYIASREEEEKEFYSVFVKTQLFKTYKRDRLEKKKDYYLNLDIRTRHISLPNEPLSRRKLSSASLQSTFSPRIYHSQKGKPEQLKFNLPAIQIPLISTQQFYNDCIEQITKEMKDVTSSSIKASYLYLRGMFHIASARPLDGLCDFHNLHSTDLSIFPVEEITRVVEDLSAAEKAQLEEQEFYQRGEILKKISQRKRPSVSIGPAVMEEIPQEGVLGFTEFVNHIQNLEIAIDVDVIERLFNALTGGHTQTGLDAETFNVFVEAWKEGALQSQAIPDQIYEKCLDNTESILKVSSLIGSRQGMGRLVMTDKRLFFLTEGSNNFYQVIRIRDIQSLEKFEQSYLLLSSVPALRIYSRRSNMEPYMANLKGERNSWYTLIHEIWSAREIADVQKDPHIVQQAALNICLLDAVIRSAESSKALYTKRLEVVSQILCHFTRLKSEGMASIHPETSHALVHKFNPSSNESQRSTVEAMIYTPGNRSYWSQHEDNCPKLWCAMGTGMVKVYNGSNFRLEAEIPKAKDRVCCLQCVNGEQVWAGSFDTTIYIIDCHTYSANKQLMDHNDIVSDITITGDQRTAYTASLNGQIIGWDTTTLSRQSTIQLQNTDKLVSIKWDDKSSLLWCCTKDDIRLVGMNGAVLQKFVYRDDQNFPILLETFIVTEDTLWAGCGRRGELVSWDKTSFQRKKVLKINCRGISKLLAVNKRLWVASKQGKIHLFNLATGKYEKALTAHDDAIRSMTQAESRYVLTGAGSRDGKVAVWRTNFQV